MCRGKKNNKSNQRIAKQISSVYVGSSVAIFILPTLYITMSPILHTHTHTRPVLPGPNEISFAAFSLGFAHRHQPFRQQNAADKNNKTQKEANFNK